MNICDGIQKKLAVIQEIRAAVEKYKLNPSFMNKFEIDYLKKETQKEIPRDLYPRIAL